MNLELMKKTDDLLFKISHQLDAKDVKSIKIICKKSIEIILVLYK